MTWIFLLVNTLLVSGAVASDQLTLGEGLGNVLKNSPYAIQNFYGVMSLLGMLMTTAYMNATANRDFSTGMYQFIFTSPIKKHHYFFGKFIGAAIVAIIPLLGVSLGSLIGPMVSSLSPERFGPVFWSAHLNGLIVYGIPNTFITGVILFGLAVLFRSSIVSFVGAMGILVFYLLAQGFISDLDKEWLACILDPFGYYPESTLSKYFTIEDKNTQSVSLYGWVLYNRLIWVSFAMLLLFVFYLRFSFSFKNKSNRPSEKLNATEELTKNISMPLITPSYRFSFSSWIRMTGFECSAILKNPPFIVLVIIGILNLSASLSSFTTSFGLSKYPVTYDIIDSIRGSFYIFLIGIITFYTGVLVWKERDSHFNEIQDATPFQTFSLLSSKLMAMVAAVTLILFSTMIVGIASQAFRGYYRFEFEVYLTSLFLIDLPSIFYLIVISMLIHYLINNRYIAYFAFVAFLILNKYIWSVLQMDSNMLNYGSIPDLTYSDMNGFGPFVQGAFWFQVYWLLFAFLLIFCIRALYIRGCETQISMRVQYALLYLKESKWQWGSVLLLFSICACYVYYHTHVVNTYVSEKENEQEEVDYELTFKKYEGLNQPRYFSHQFEIHVYPESRSLEARVVSLARNISNQPITDLHFTIPSIPDSVKILIKNAFPKLINNRLKYRIYTLTEPLMPGDSIKIQFDILKKNKGFENEVSFLQLTNNGTFFNNTDIVPQIGYVSNNEVADKNRRRELNLPKRNRTHKLDETNLSARANTYITECADWVDVKTIISTSEDQIAVAPGSLIKQWKKGNRNFYHYELDHISLDFYSFISADYEVKRKKWKGIDLEVYYIPEHAYNVPLMMKSLEKSLAYYTSHFGPYYHHQCRIIEFPRYRSFAQAFPGTMPYSESIGFITDLRNVNSGDIDMVFFVVAHEMAHQYWAHQLCGAAMQGSEWMSEGFAEYSALMVMEKEYGHDSMNKFLKYLMDEYLSNRGREAEAEQPIYKTENQAYIHYQKAGVAMYYLKEMIGEQKVNLALRNLLDSFAYKNPPYPTSLHALRALSKQTPDSLSYLIHDLFKTITLFSNKMEEARVKKIGNEFEVSITFTSEKFRADSMGKEKAIPVNDYMDLICFAKPIEDEKFGKKLFYQRTKISQKQNHVVFRTKEMPYLVGIDPYNYIIDRFPDDNTKKLALE
ncbi:MAG: M1 family aminopeptidase [Bacteroidota bacterium]